MTRIESGTIERVRGVHWTCLMDDGSEVGVRIHDLRPPTVSDGGTVRYSDGLGKIVGAVTVYPEPLTPEDPEWKDMQDQAVAKAEAESGSTCWSSFRTYHPTDWER